MKLSERFAEAVASALESDGEESAAWRFAEVAWQLVDRHELDFVDVDAMDR